MVAKVRIAIIDDHPMVRRGVTETFAEQADFQVVADGDTSDIAVEHARNLKLDLIVLDVSLPGGGVEAARQIARHNPETAILMLSIREDIATVRAALKAGAKGYIAKGVDGSELVAAARKVLAGERYVSPALAARLIEGVDDAAQTLQPVGSASPGGPAPAQAELNHREQQIFELLGLGLTNLEIAHRLELSENTVKHYITPLLQKLKARNRTEAALMARSRLAGDSAKP
jgi:two-component system, NarL family, nitrate/nitrite response regulator NarL